MAPGGSGLFGRDILSTFKNGGYEELAGTSQATPHVAGVAALLVGKGVRGQAAVQRILATATDAGLPGPDAEYGAGIVNARAAVAGLPASGQPGGGIGSAAMISLRKTLRIRTALRRGIRVRCLAAGAGRCRVAARSKGRRVATGSKALRAGRRRSRSRASTAPDAACCAGPCARADDKAPGAGHAPRHAATAAPRHAASLSENLTFRPPCSVPMGGVAPVKSSTRV